MININKAVMHILDCRSEVKVFSEQEMDLTNSNAVKFITKHIEKSSKDSDMRSGYLNENSRFYSQLKAYLDGAVSFVEFSIWIADLMYETIKSSDKPESSDMFLCDVAIDDVRQIVLLKCLNKVGYTHQVTHENGMIQNEVIKHFSILPSTTQRMDSFAFINTEPTMVKFLDKNYSVDGQETALLSEVLLECSFTKSTKETVKLMNLVSETVAENFGANAVEAVAAVKNCMIESLEDSDSIDPVAMGRQVFASSPGMQKAFAEELASVGISEPISVEKVFVGRANKMHKIKTDTGIEVSFPVDYYHNDDFIEFINKPDGTLAIELKNIGQITNK